MRDIQEYAIRCMDMLDRIGIQYGNIQEVTVNTRAKSRWGQCKSVPGCFTINVNVALLDEGISDDGLINTLLHELLHSVSGCMNHGVKWKAAADQVYRAYGIRIKRTSTSEEKGVSVETVEPNYKYFVKCPDCGYVFKYMRMCECVKNPSRYKHTGCKNNLVRVFGL